VQCGARMSALETAICYVRRGWRVVPIPTRSKNPGFASWQQLRLAERELPNHFNGAPQNIGVLLGEPSGWLIDVDLDHPLAVALADQLLPPTPAQFGRPSKPRSHRLYRVKSPVSTTKHKSKSAGMIVEVRSTGSQTVFPGSEHESREMIEWEDEDADPAEIDPDALLAAVKDLADHVKVELGERRSTPKDSSGKEQASPAERPPLVLAVNERERRCLTAMLRMQLPDQRDGSGRLFAAACRIVEHDLDDEAGLTTIAAYAHQRPFPKDWTRAEILQRIRDAERRCLRGDALRAKLDPEGLCSLGTRDVDSCRLVLSAKRTWPTGEAFVREFHEHPDRNTLCNHGGLLMEWTGNRYAPIEEEAIKRQLHRWMHDAKRYAVNPRTKQAELVDFKANPATVKAALETVRSYVHLPANVASPSWLNRSPANPPPLEIVPCHSALLHVPTRQLMDSTPNFFTHTALDFDPDFDAGPPEAWFDFLFQLFGRDVESVTLLQEWFGYCLLGDTSLQKMLLIVGPRRAGKGTLAQVLMHLVGVDNVCGPTTSSLAGPFGLQPLLGKSLAIVSDARFSGDDMNTVVERLLCISGQDLITIDRKHIPSVTLRLPLKFMFLTNELPRLSDASGALAGRFVVIRLTNSFFGKEDPQLLDKLLVELPGILNWALEGLDRLRSRQRFIMPQSVADAVLDMTELASPVQAFARACCIVEEGQRVSVNELFAAWKTWCMEEGRSAVGTRHSQGRSLAAAFPGIRRRRGTDDAAFYDGIGVKP